MGSCAPVSLTTAFIGRRAGTAPSDIAFGRLFAGSLLGLIPLVALAFWAAIRPAWLWVGAQVKHQTDSGGLAIVACSIGMLLTLVPALVLVKRLDQFWILVRRATGYVQRGHDGRSRRRRRARGRALRALVGVPV